MNERPSYIALKFRKDLKEKQTFFELRMKSILNKMGVKYRSQKLFQRNGIFRIVDFYLPLHGVVIEIDGKHHYTKERREYDSKRSDFLKNKCGVKKVVRFSNRKVLQGSHWIELKLNRILFPDSQYIEAKSEDMDREFMKTMGVY